MSHLKSLIFHHIGVACERIESESMTWTALGYRPEGEAFVDEGQGIRGLFMVGKGPRIELLEGTGGSSTLAPLIRRGVKLYHMGYLTESFDEAFEALVADGATVAREPMISVYFGARIAFLMMPNMVITELVEAGPYRARPKLETPS